MDINKINKNYEIIEKYSKILDDFEFKNKEDFMQKTKDYLAVSMSLFTILNACIEIGESLIELKKLTFPTSYKEIFQILKKEKILSSDLANDLSDFMRQRNMLAHQYDEINYEDLYEVFLERDIFIDFIEESKKKFE